MVRSKQPGCYVPAVTSSWGNSMSVDLFLNTLFKDKPDHHYILIWEKPLKQEDQKVSHWFNKLSDAIKYFHEYGSLQDTYVGCGTSSKLLPSFRRCKAHEISGIPGVWLDVDILDPVHSKPNLPETPEQALEIIELFPLKPSIIVHSGHGYQFWWLFDRFGDIPDNDRRNKAADLIHLFNWSMCDRARSMGFDVDKVFDLSRVFRIPGGKNYKDKDHPLPVVMQKCDPSLRYSIPEFMAAIKELRARLGEDATEVGERKSVSNEVGSKIEGKKWILDPEATYDKDKFDALYQYDQKFRQSWDHDRKDFKDTSASSYDQSLATIAMMAYWDDQEIINLLIAFRRRHNLKQKLVEQYFERTLITARKWVEKNNAVERINELVDKYTPENINNPEPDKSEEENTRLSEDIKEKARVLLSQCFPIEYLGITKYKGDPAQYKLNTIMGDVMLGPIGNLFNQTAFIQKYGEATDVMLSPFKKPVWESIVNAMLLTMNKVDLGDEAKSQGQIAYFLNHFLDHFTPLYDKDEAIYQERSFYWRNCLWISSLTFKRYLGQHEKENVTPKQLGLMLREYGFEPDNINVVINGKPSTRNLWKISIDKDHIAAQHVDRDLLANSDKEYWENSMKREKNLKEAC